MDFEDENTPHHSSPVEEIAQVGLGMGLIFESPIIVSEVADTLGVRLESSMAGELGELTGNAMNTAYYLAPLVGIMAIMATGFRMMMGGGKRNAANMADD